MLLDGKRVCVAKGDTIHWDEDSGAIVITRYSPVITRITRLRWQTMIGDPDDKKIVPGIRKVTFVNLVDALAQVLNLNTEVVASAHKPTYKFV